MPLAFKRYPYGGLGDWLLPFAGVAQLVAQVLCNHQVAGSSPVASSRNCGNGRPHSIINRPSTM